MQIISFTWNDKLSDASQQAFLKQKQRAEIAVSSFTRGKGIRLGI